MRTAPAGAGDDTKAPANGRGTTSTEKARSMQNLLSKIHLGLLLASLTAFWTGCGQEAPEKAAEPAGLSQEELGEYSHGLAAKEMRFLWTLRGDSLDVKLVAPTTGWVGIGFNPDETENMKGASFIIGYVKAGEAHAFDHYGTEAEKHKEDDKLGGTTDVSNLSGSEEERRTELAFTVPLNSADPNDRPLSVDGDNVILLAYGKSDSFVLKHRFRAALKVNLSTGEYSVVKMK